MSILEDEYVYEAQFVYQNLYQNFLSEFKIMPQSKTAKKLGRLCSAAFLFGNEYGKEDLRRNIRMMEEDEEDYSNYVSVGVRPQRESESSKIINNLHPGENILEFDNAKTARKKFDSLQKFAKYRRIQLKMKQQGNLLYLLKE